MKKLFLINISLCLILLTSCGENIGVAPLGSGTGSISDSGPAAGSHFLVSTGGDSCNEIDVTAYQGCIVKNFKVTTTPGGFGPFTTYVLPCGSCGTCPYGTALSDSTNCGCSTPGYSHFNIGNVLAWSAFPQGVPSPGVGLLISSSALSVYMQDLTASGTVADIDLELDCP